MAIESIESFRHALVIVSLLCHCFLSVSRANLPVPVYLTIFVMDFCLIMSMALDYFVPGECSRYSYTYIWYVHVCTCIPGISKHEARRVLPWPSSHTQLLPLFANTSFYQHSIVLGKERKTRYPLFLIYPSLFLPWILQMLRHRVRITTLKITWILLLGITNFLSFSVGLEPVNVTGTFAIKRRYTRRL